MKTGKKRIALTAVLLLCLSLSGCKSQDYDEAMKLYVDGEYEAACAIFTELGDYEDSEEMVRKSKYAQATEYLNDDNPAWAAELFEELGDYKDSSEKAQACQLMEEGKYDSARELFTQLGDYKDSANRLQRLGWYSFYDYIAEAGTIVIESSTDRGLTLTAEADFIKATYDCKDVDDDTSVIYSVTAEIGTDNTQVAIYGNTDYRSEYGYTYYKEEAHGTWDISSFQDGDPVYWDYYDDTGLVRGGRVIYTDFRGFIKDAKSKLSTIAELTAQALEESGLGLTMADIGFASYEGQE